jgi:arylsulfatase
MTVSLMFRRIGLPAFAAAVLLGCSNVRQPIAVVSKPNVLLIVADDLGYSDIGAFGSEISTPNLDQLARSGRVLTNFHTSPNCSPTRAMLMSGADSHVAGLGSMAETTTALVRDGVAPFGDGARYGWDSLPRGYEGYLNDTVQTMPELFKAAGYHTYMVGKWHLASTVNRFGKVYRPESLPNAKGFQRSFALMEGGAPHFAPTEGKSTVADRAVTYLEDDKPATLPSDFYSSTSYTDKLIAFIDEGRKDGRPFLAYAAYTAPHFPLQAPDADIARQRGKYDAGYEVVRERRMDRQVQLGLIPAAFKSVASGQGPRSPNWSDMSAEQRVVEAKKMEVYAAMVESLDQNIGRLLEHLKTIGAYDNTIVVFMSDNGAHAGPRSNFADDANTDNSLGNMGRPRSNITYGPRWAEVSATPFKLWKRYSSEGGISAPLIVRLPNDRPGSGPVRQLAHVTDVLPTLLEAAGLKPSPHAPAVGGQSILAELTGGSPAARTQVSAGARTIAGELFGGRYVHDGEWKLLAVQPPLGNGSWMLFDMKADRGETNDLSKAHPAEAERLRRRYDEYASKAGVVELPAGTRIPAAFD